MEYYSFISHGVLLDNKKLDPIDRKLHETYIPIIMFGTQTLVTQNSFTLSYYILFTKKYGVHFLNELVYALKEHPRDYIRLYHVRDSQNPYQIAVRYLFDINSVEIQNFPQNKFRVFVNRDPLRQPLDIFLTSNREMVVGKITVHDEYSKALVIDRSPDWTQCFPILKRTGLDPSPCSAPLENLKVNMEERRI